MYHNLKNNKYKIYIILNKKTFINKKKIKQVKLK